MFLYFTYLLILINISIKDTSAELKNRQNQKLSTPIRSLCVFGMIFHTMLFILYNSIQSSIKKWIFLIGHLLQIALLIQILIYLKKENKKYIPFWIILLCIGLFYLFEMTLFLVIAFIRPDIPIVKPFSIVSFFSLYSPMKKYDQYITSMPTVSTPTSIPTPAPVSAPTPASTAVDNLVESESTQK